MWKPRIDFLPLWSKSGMVFKGTTRVYERICLFNSKWIVKKEKYLKSFELNFGWILPILDFGTDAKLNYATNQVLKRVRILEASSENGCGKWHVLVWNRVRIWRTEQHTPTENSEEYPPTLPGTIHLILPDSVGHKAKDLSHSLSICLCWVILPIWESYGFISWYVWLELH